MATFIQVHDSAAWGVNLDITIHQAAEAWLAEKEKPMHELSLGTLRPYRSIVQRIKLFFPPEIRAVEVAPADIRRFLGFLEKEYSLSPQGIRKRLGHVSMIFRFQAREGNLVRNPCDAVSPPATRSIRTKAMSVDNYKALMEDLSEWARDGRELRSSLQDLVFVLWLSGLRSIEAFRIRWEDIDLDEALWIIRSPRQKGGVRIEPIHQKLLPTLVRLSKMETAGPFENEWPLRNEWRRFKEKYQRWNGCSLHSLRHAFVTRLAKQGNPAITKYLSGHRSDAMSDHYTHLGPEDVRDPLNMLS